MKFHLFYFLMSSLIFLTRNRALIPFDVPLADLLLGLKIGGRNGDSKHSCALRRIKLSQAGNVFLYKLVCSGFTSTQVFIKNTSSNNSLIGLVFFCPYRFLRLTRYNLDDLNFSDESDARHLHVLIMHIVASLLRLLVRCYTLECVVVIIERPPQQPFPLFNNGALRSSVTKATRSHITDCYRRFWNVITLAARGEYSGCHECCKKYSHEWN